MIVPVNVLPFSWVLLRPCCHAMPGSAHREALGMGWADTASAYSSNLFCSWVEYHLLQLLEVDGIDDLCLHAMVAPKERCNLSRPYLAEQERLGLQ